MTTERFQILNMAEVTADDDGKVVECHGSVRILDDDGKVRSDVPLHFILYAAIDTVASIWERADGPMSKEDFITTVEDMLRESLDEIKVTAAH